MIGRGVPAGARSPIHEAYSKPFRPDSDTVGTAGAAAERRAVDTASARSLAVFTCGRAVVIVAKLTCTSPLISATTAGEPPL